VQKGIALIVSQGLVPTIESVGKLVGSKDAKVVRDRFEKRKIATAQERNQLIEGLLVCMESGPTLRVTSRQTRARNVFTVLISILTGESIAAVLALPRERIHENMRAIEMSLSSDKALLALLRNAFLAADALYSSRIKTDGDHPFLIPLKGFTLPSRGALLMLRCAMAGMDPRLQRVPRVFFTGIGSHPIVCV
jgi:hypothetical protein